MLTVEVAEKPDIQQRFYKSTGLVMMQFAGRMMSRMMDSNNMQSGRVKADGTVVDRNNMTIGYAKGIPTTYAAVFFFFKMFE